MQFQNRRDVSVRMSNGSTFTVSVTTKIIDSSSVNLEPCYTCGSKNQKRTDKTHKYQRVDLGNIECDATQLPVSKSQPLGQRIIKTLDEQLLKYTCDSCANKVPAAR